MTKTSNYHLGNVIKYVCRAGHKSPDTKIEDLEKAIHYLENELEHTALQEPKFKRSSNTIPQLVWDPEQCGQPDYATGLIDEEFQEFRDAHYNETYENELKELADLVYVCFQYAENMEWDLEEALNRIHKSNMSKLGLDGTPIRRSDGKILKGPNYQPPTLIDLVKK